MRTLVNFTVRPAGVARLVGVLLLASWCGPAGAVLLPGFAPIHVEGTTVRLGGGRTYEWRDSLLPVRLNSAGERLVSAIEIDALVQGTRVRSRATEVSVVESDETRAVVSAVGELGPLTIRALTTVEYDGVAQTQLTLSGRGRIDDLRVMVRLPNRPAMRRMTWPADGYRSSMRKFTSARPDAGQARGLFEIVALADGDRSFWWISDGFRGWRVSRPAETTVVSATGEEVSIEQTLISGAYDAAGAERNIEFAFLATPVRDTASWRNARQRPTRLLTAEEAKAGGVHLWWPEALPHQALALSDQSPVTAALVPPRDRDKYPGSAAVKAEIYRARKLGIERLPYFSLHAPSPLDPVLAEHPQWRVQPSFVTKPGNDLPFTVDVPRPWLSLNADGVVEHMTASLLAVAEQIDCSGFYFDQGAPIDSLASSHGGWRDDSGRMHAALDVLSIRRFYRELAEGLLAQGKEPRLYVHNSSVPIAPAYTFVTAMVQGEEFLQDLVGYDYLASAPIDLIRAQYSPDQYGIGSLWMEQLWSPGVERKAERGSLPKDEWIASKRYERATRTFFAAALLHDVTPWSLAPVAMRRAVFDWIDRYRTPANKFVGYWQQRDADPKLPISLYVDSQRRAVLFILVNLDSGAVKFDLQKLPREHLSTLAADAMVRQWPGKTFERWNGGAGRHVDIAPHDFAMIEITAD